MRPILASLLLVTTTTTTLRGKINTHPVTPFTSFLYSSRCLLLTYDQPQFLVAGLAAASDPLKPYGGGTVSLIDDVFSDPDHLVSPYDGHHIIQLLKTCGDQARHKVVVYLAANFTSNDNVKPTTTTSSTVSTTVTTTAANPDSGGGGGARGRGQRWSRSTVDEVDGSTVIIHLKELVVAANNLTNTNPSVILLVVIRKPFQVSQNCRWRSPGRRMIASFTFPRGDWQGVAPEGVVRNTSTQAAVVKVGPLERKDGSIPVRVSCLAGGTPVMTTEMTLGDLLRGLKTTTRGDTAVFFFNLGGGRLQATAGQEQAFTALLCNGKRIGVGGGQHLQGDPPHQDKKSDSLTHEGEEHDTGCDVAPLGSPQQVACSLPPPRLKKRTAMSPLVVVFSPRRRSPRVISVVMTGVLLARQLTLTGILPSFLSKGPTFTTAAWVEVFRTAPSGETPCQSPWGKMATWRSDSQRFTLLKALHNNTAPLDQQRFTAAVVHVAQDLCQSERVSRSKPQSRIIFTILWIAFTIMFVALLVAIAVVLIRGYREAVGWARTEEGQQMVRPARSQLFARGSDIQDFSAVSFLSTGHVLLGTMDIAAVMDIAVVPQQGCTSTDNLLQV
ncbi:hypothetical protein GWK47_027236 [Chionoecetes opilio]|uniref:Uncharacterized protein n=1 Tax=Chionoecetes opilio TaxID=41210 RepID=A0A8J8WNG1_CHIOP|nr:hypothetical protein GWK47_027236 [Chionoecetes opilio]